MADLHSLHIGLDSPNIGPNSLQLALHVLKLVKFHILRFDLVLQPVDLFQYALQQRLNTASGRTSLLHSSASCCSEAQTRVAQLEKTHSEKWPEPLKMA